MTGFYVGLATGVFVTAGVWYLVRIAGRFARRNGNALFTEGDRRSGL
jgi:hypothetical protein